MSVRAILALGFVCALPASTSWAANTATIVQNGAGHSYNQAYVGQSGRTNTSTTVQFGRVNSAVAVQRGRNNDAAIGQSGRFNSGAIFQTMP